MAVQNAFPAVLVGSILAVSAAGVLTGTHIRSVREHATPGTARIEATSTIVTSALADEQPTAVTRGPRPTFSRIVIEPTGISRLEGAGPPGGQVTLNAAGRPIAVTTVDGGGRWAVTLTKALPPGEHRIAAVLGTSSGAVAGEDVRVFVPVDLAGEAVVAYEATGHLTVAERAASQPVSDDVRRRAGEIADEATKTFGVILDGEQKKKKAPEAATRVAGDAGPAVPEAAREGDSPEPGATLLERLQRWFGSASETYRRDVARPLSLPAPGTPEADALVRAQQEKKDRAKAAARRYAEKRREAEQSLAAAKAKQEREAEANGTAEKTAALKSRQAEAARREQENGKRAAEEAARRTAETEAQFESSLKRLDEAQRAQDERAMAEAQKSIDAARADYQARRAAAEEIAARDAADSKVAAERAAAKAAADKAAAEKAAQKAAADKAATARAAAEQLAADKRAAEAARQEKARLALAQEEKAKADAEEARRRRAAETKAAEETRIAEENRRRKEAEEEADAEQDEREWAIYRRMLAEQDRRPGGGSLSTSEIAAALESGKVDGREPAPAARATRSTGRHLRADRRTREATRCRGRGKARRGYHYLTGKETLWGLARRYYGDGRKFDVIFRANRDKIRDPDVLRPCCWIRIPGKR